MRVVTSMLATLFAIPVCASAAGGNFTLSIFEGFNFASGRVVKSGTDTADLSFTYQTRRIGFISYLGADKISYFESAPASVSPSEVSSWKDYVAGPEPGYYVVRARSDQRLYLVRLIEFSNQGRAASYWKMRFDWQELGVDTSAGEDRSGSRYRDSRGSVVRPEQPASYNRNSQSESAGSRASGSGDASLRRAGHDVAYEARRRVALEVELVTPLTAGMGGELKWIALCEPGTREKVGTDMILPNAKLTLSVPPGRYDLWIEGRNNKGEMLRTVDLSGYNIGDVVSTTVRFPGWGAGERDSNRTEPARTSSRTSQTRKPASPDEESGPARGRSNDAEQRIRRAQEKAAQRSQSTNADLEERIRRAQEKAERRNQ